MVKDQIVYPPGATRLRYPKRSAANIIATHFCTDIASIQEGRYHYGRTTIPVYVLGNDYYCCPPEGGKPAKLDGEHHWAWNEDAVLFGRTIYKATPTMRNEVDKYEAWDHEDAMNTIAKMKG